MSFNFCPILVSILLFSDIISCEKYNACNFLSAYPLKSIFGKLFCHDNPDVSSKTPNLIARYNFTSETHKLVTSDGYILTLFRIPPKDESKPVVFLQHGIIMNSESFVCLGPKSLEVATASEKKTNWSLILCKLFHNPIIVKKITALWNGEFFGCPTPNSLWLAGMGHEVWLGNLRGTFYSKEHVNISSENNEFWDFNQDKMAVIDIREQLQYVNKLTQKPVIYVGYSMGTTLMFMYASKYPEEAQCLVKGFIALSPVAYMRGMRASFIVKAVFTPLITTYKVIDRKVILYDEMKLQRMLMNLCDMFPHICIKVVNLFAGRTKNLSPKNMQMVLSHIFQATARDVSLQYMQNLYSGEFKHFNYGTFENFDVYGKKSPPDYDLKQIKLPVFLFYGPNDAMTTQANVQRIYNELGSSVKEVVKVPEKGRENGFNHLDFLFSDNIENFLYVPLHRIIKQNLS